MFVCECSKELLHKTSFSRHKNKCQPRVIILELRETIKKLETKVELLKENQGTTTIYNNSNNTNTNTNTHNNTTIKDSRKIESNNNSTNNIENNHRIDKIINSLQPLDYSKFSQQLDYLNLSDLKCPQKLSNYASENLLKDRVFCSDVKKQLCHFKDVEGNIVKDPKLKLVTEKIYNALDSDGYTKEDSPEIHKDNFKKKFVKHTCSSMGTS